MADLTREQIEAMRLTLEEHLNMSYAHGVEDALNTLCDMALRSLRQSEPTEAMIEAGCKALSNYHAWEDSSSQAVLEIWRAMTEGK